MHSCDVRASDLDRERAVEFLKAHYAAGRLQHDELAMRTDAAYRAVVISELDWLTADLPALFRASQRRRRRPSVTAAALICALLVVLLVIMPIEVWLVLMALAAWAGFIGLFVLAPFAIPVLVIAGIIHLVARATRPQRPPPVGWRQLR